MVNPTTVACVRFHDHFPFVMLRYGLPRDLAFLMNREIFREPKYRTEARRLTVPLVSRPGGVGHGCGRIRRRRPPDFPVRGGG